MALRCPLNTALGGGPNRAGGRLIDTRLKIRPAASFLSAANGNPRCHSAVLPSRLFSISPRRHGSTAVVRVPAMAESITEGQLNQFSKRAGDFIEQDEELATIETDKIDVSVNAPHAGIIERILAGEGDAVTVDQEIAEIQIGKQLPSANEENNSIPKTMQKTPSMPVQEREGQIQSSSSALPPESQPAHLANAAPETSEQNPRRADVPLDQPAALSSRPRRAERKVKMPRIRQRTAQRLLESQNTAAFLTTFNEVDMSRVIEFRQTYKDAVLEKHNVKVGFMGFMARASALALKEIPMVNASIENDDMIVYRDYVDLNVATAIPKGLVTPVIRNIESMSIVQIEKGIAEQAKKARDGKLTLSDLEGGSFTISNSGIWGSLFGTPILTTPQTAVLGTYGIQERPMAVNGRTEIRPMMYTALTYDHRLIDGREAVLFLNLVKKYVQDPERMLLE